MAQSVLKLVVDDKEYEASLKRAKAGMQDLQQSLQTAGKTFDQVDQSVVDYAKAIGNMATVSQTAKGKLNEMTSTFTELSVQYKNLTDEEKNSPFGKALAESLDTLKGRIIDSKRELDDVKNSLTETANEGNKTGGIMQQLAGKFTINVDAMKVFSLGLQAADKALKVAKDAFFASESTVDEWGRTMQSAQSLYEGFLTAINNGDISGYLSRIDEIVKAARSAYDELDRLGSMKTIQSPAMSREQSEISRLRMIVQTGRYIAPAGGGGTSLLKEGQILTPAQIKGFENLLDRALGNIVQLNKNELDQTGKAIEAYYKSLAVQNGMSLEEFKKGTSSWDEFSKKLEGFDKYQKWREKNTTIDLQTGREIVARGNPYAAFAKWGTFRVDKMGENSYNDLVNLIKSQEQQKQQLYSTIGQSYRAANRIEGITVRGLMKGDEGGGGGGGGVKNIKAEIENATGSIADFNAQISALKKLQDQVTDTESWQQYQYSIEILTMRIKALRGDLDLTPTDMKGVSVTAEALKTLEGGPMINYKRVNRGRNALSNIANGLNGDGSQPAKPEQPDNGKSFSEVYGQMTSSLSTIAGGIEQLGIKIPDGINQVLGMMQTISGILTGIASLVSAINAVSTISAIIPGMAGGGVAKAAKGLVVPGRHFSGDMVPAMLNSGETVLNSAQTNAVVSQLQHSGLGNLHLSTELSGESIRIVLNNNNRRRGKGELVTTKKWG